jgi:N-acetylglutamate synthase-like GNAT family acetyltransferase
MCVLNIKNMIEIKEAYFYSDDKKDMDFDVIFRLIKNSYWGNRRTQEEQKTALDNTLNFGLFHNNTQIAFARVMTDKVFFAYLLDVIVDENHRGKGLSKLLIANILNNSDLQKIDKWILATKDAHSLYEKFGFEALKKPEMIMEKLSKRAKLIYE